MGSPNSGFEPTQPHQNGEKPNGVGLWQDDTSDFRSFEIPDLGSGLNPTPTGVKDDIILLSWLIVLARTREDDETRFEWSYCGNGGNKSQVTRVLSTNEVISNRQNDIRQTAEAISRHIELSVPNSRSEISSNISLLLSTGVLCQAQEDVPAVSMPYSLAVRVQSTDLWLPQTTFQLQVQYHQNRLRIRPAWCGKSVMQYTVTRHIETLVDTIQGCLSRADDPIELLYRPSAHDMDQIWKWNNSLPPTYSFPAYAMISQKAQRHPDKEAISSWDGSFTYSEIETYSTNLAHILKESGVSLGEFVPICFEKSKWTAVAVLAVMKSGATFVLMDPTLPLARLQNMANQVGARKIVSSRLQHGLSESIITAGKTFVVEPQTFDHQLNSTCSTELKEVPSSTLMYVIFTSGSTGTPKGVKISHESYTSSAIPRARAVGYTEESRVLDFASYAFDVSIDSMLLTLSNGGCLCIPSDEDRLNDINGVIRRMQVNYAGLTPSVARILDPDVITSLSGLGLGGEAVSARDVTLWGRDTRIIIGYGPCECTIGCTVNPSAATGRDYITIGPGNGSAIWITDPNDHDSLMPIGAVGELLVEGPIVGQGYLNDPDRTAASFIEDPPWLVTGYQSYKGRRGRLYKTGDLGKYDPYGSGEIVFVGRKDTQVKLRGQRVELGEIESQLRSQLPPETNVIAEVITPKGSSAQSTLVAFIASQFTKTNDSSDMASVQLSSGLQEQLLKVDAHLATVLPRYMIPTSYIPVNYIPTLISGKTDRKKLRQFGATVELRQLDQFEPGPVSEELTALEDQLRQAWSLVLGADPNAIRPGDNFFALGGDSLAAMKLVSVCRECGLVLTVGDTFGNPTLSQMAATVTSCDIQAKLDISEFSMISQDVTSARTEASYICGTEATAIEDIYPCSPTQESLFTFSIKSPQPYIAQRIACIPSHITLDAWQRAWEEVVNANPILRTRLVQLQDPGLQQVVLKERVHWRQSSDLKLYLQGDLNEKMGMGDRLSRYAIIKSPTDGKTYMVWTIHHVLYDGWSEPIILEKLRTFLLSQTIEAGLETQMRDFVKFLRDTDELATQEFWRHELEGAVGPQFPRLPSRDFLPTPDSLVERNIPLKTSSITPFTPATLIRGAWALVASQYSGSDDVVFGETFTGRDIPLPGVQNVLGPLVATMPVRIRIDRNDSVASYLTKIQQGILSRSPYQHIGMQNIRKVSVDAQYACEAGTGLVIQPDSENVAAELGFEETDVVREALHFNPYPLMVACGLQKGGGFRACASFDSTLISTAQMERILAQLEQACIQLMGGLSKKLSSISCIPETELSQIWAWNQTRPLALDAHSKTFRARESTQPNTVYPPALVRWVCDPRNPSLLSPIGCVGELWLEGEFLQGNTVDSPSWLLTGCQSHSGRNGKVQSTGDLALLREDGSILFIGRKEDVVSMQGHAMNVSDLQDHFHRFLPRSYPAAAAFSNHQPSNSHEAQEHELVVFVEQHNPEQEGVKLLSESHNLILDESSPDGLTITIPSTMSTSLSMALKKLHKFIQDSLPSYMLPLVYIPVDRLPTNALRMDHNLLNRAASNIPRHILDQLRNSLTESWKQESAESTLTPKESVLRSSWAKILGLEEGEIEADDNFFRLGGDSVLAMKLVSTLRAQGYRLTVADVFQHMRLRDAAKVLEVDEISIDTTPAYQAFSTLEYPDMQLFLSHNIRPKLSEPRWSVQDVFAVTDSQALDIRATIKSPRTSVQYTILYFNQAVDQNKLSQACGDLVHTHDILRTIFIEHESSFLQVVIAELDGLLTTKVADRDIERFATDFCEKDIESDFNLGSPFLKMFHVVGESQQDCLIIRLSHAQYDGISLPRLLRDLEALYTGDQVSGFEPFSSYLWRLHNKSSQAKSLHYWSSLLDGSSLSVLEKPLGMPGDTAVFQEKSVGSLQPPDGITTANLLTAAWALLLARRLQTRDVTFGSVTSGRGLDLINVENVVGPCYQLSPIRVQFQPQWTAMALLRFVQRQVAESAAHDFLGFSAIAEQCAKWDPEATFFDSIVHHQDFEDFDTMPFAWGTCRVEISNPHGEAAHPVKAVSFVRDGEMHVGVVGSAGINGFVDAVLSELVATVQELSSCSSGSMLINIPVI